MCCARFQLQLQSLGICAGAWLSGSGPGNPEASAMARSVSTAWCNLDSSLHKPDFAALLSGEKTAGDWDTTEQTLLRTL